MREPKERAALPEKNENMLEKNDKIHFRNDMIHFGIETPDGNWQNMIQLPGSEKTIQERIRKPRRAQAEDVGCSEQLPGKCERNSARIIAQLQQVSRAEWPSRRCFSCRCSAV